MRLLHCSPGPGESITVDPVDFVPSQIPPYAILSHTWGQDVDEVSFQDFENNRAGTRRGYAKIIGCARQALSDGLEYIWIDTCCINKSSSSELSEAINSMYAWYQRSQVCYAYLDDVSSDDTLLHNSMSDRPATLSGFQKSRWFTRGWTLQELLAPAYVVFFAKDWVEIGSKGGLAYIIEGITNIDARVLMQRDSQTFCIATKMSWAANRKTTRVEDRAYSLMGLFGVHMPAIYGEGTNAFTRLQLEILKTSNDQSIFAWQPISSPLHESYSMLADSPDYFAGASKFESIGQDEFVKTFDIRDPKADYAMTNAGLNIQLPLLKLGSVSGEDMFIAYLACVYGEQRSKTWIFLKRLEDTTPDSRKSTHAPRNSRNFIRMTVAHHTTQYGSVSADPGLISVESICVAGSNHPHLEISELRPTRTELSHKFIISMVEGSDFAAVSHFPRNLWTIGNQVILRVTAREAVSYGNVIFHNPTTGESFAAFIGVNNRVAWSDVIFLPKIDVTAANTFNNYFTCKAVFSKYNLGTGDCGYIQQKGLDWVKTQSWDPDRTLVITTRKASIVGDTITYSVRIKIT